MFIFDTNVVSELRKRDRAEAKVWNWASTVPSSMMHLSVVTVQEIELGILRLERKDKKQAAILREWFEGLVLPSFAGRILPVEEAIALRCARLHVPDPRPERECPDCCNGAGAWPDTCDSQCRGLPTNGCEASESLGVTL